MKEFKYNKKLIRLWLFKVALFFSVFAFSGFNLQTQATFHQSVKTELVESRICKPVYRLKKFTKKYGKIFIASPPLDIKLFNIWAFLNLNNLLEVEFKSCNKKTFLYSIITIKLPFKTPSSEDEIPRLSVS